MSKSVKRSSRRTSRRPSTSETDVSAMARPEEMEPTIDLVIREKLGDLITSLIFTSQDVGFELAMLKCSQRENCPLVEKTRDLIKQVKELFELQREMAKKGMMRGA